MIFTSEFTIHDFQEWFCNTRVWNNKLMFWWSFVLNKWQLTVIDWMNVFTVKAWKENRVTMEELLLLEMNGGNRTMQFYLYCVGLSKEDPWRPEKGNKQGFWNTKCWQPFIIKIISLKDILYFILRLMFSLKQILQNKK